MKNYFSIKIYGKDKIEQFEMYIKPFKFDHIKSMSYDIIDDQIIDCCIYLFHKTRQPIIEYLLEFHLN
jgi:hypothetical protein